MNLGETIKHFRKRKKLSLDKLANHTDLSPSFISQAERNVTSPSINSLKRIATALGVPVAVFFLKEEPKGIVFIKKAKKKNPSFCDILTMDVINIKMRPILFTLAKGRDTREKLISHNGEEIGIIIKGQVDLKINEDRHHLNAGDGFYLVRPKAHKLINAGNSEAVIFLVISK